MAKDSATKNSQTVTEEDSLDYVLNFQRHELKYFIPKERMEILIPELLRYMKFDDYSADGYYNLYSVYFDTEDWQAFYEKLDGIERRKKFRLRSYTANPKPDTPIMIEVKEKNKDIILKRRAAVKYKDLNKFLINKEKILEDDSAHDEWRYNLLRNGLKPKILIAYERKAFVPRQHGDWRVTIDRNVSHSFVKDGTDFGADTRLTQWARNYTVLEVKYGTYPPKFVIDLIRKYNLRNEAISKFADSIITHHNLVN